jgi:hypothetical protein
VRRHPFDPISLVFGLAFAAAALVVLFGGDLDNDGQLLLPATLVGLGIALLVQNALRSQARRAASSPAAAVDVAGAGPGSDRGPDGEAEDPEASDPDRLAALAAARAELDAQDPLLISSSGIEWTGPPPTSETEVGRGGTDPSEERNEP